MATVNTQVHITDDDRVSASLVGSTVPVVVIKLDGLPFAPNIANSQVYVPATAKGLLYLDQLVESLQEVATDLASTLVAEGIK